MNSEMFDRDTRSLSDLMAEEGLAMNRVAADYLTLELKAQVNGTLNISPKSVS